ncbi:hypothetical protein L6R52_32185, partial [Myxococcota bacterium]|nr:hypothetical protein [Myxococcota bacterium]
MAWNTSGPAQLGADDVIRFSDAEHFLRELGGNLGEGRAVVRSKRRFEARSAISVRFEAPGIAWGVSADAVVAFARDGLAGLDLVDPEGRVRAKLRMLGEEVAQSLEEIATQGERTVVAPLPSSFPGHEVSVDEPEASDLEQTEERSARGAIRERASVRVPSPDEPEPSASPPRNVRPRERKPSRIIKDPRG